LLGESCYVKVVVMYWFSYSGSGGTSVLNYSYLYLSRLSFTG